MENNKRVMVIMVRDLDKEWKAGEVEKLVGEAMMVGLSADKNKPCIKRTLDKETGELRAAVIVTDSPSDMTANSIRNIQSILH